MLTVVFNTFGIFFFLFIFWKRLKEDYVSNMLFTMAFYIIVGVFLGRAASFYFLPQWWFWTSFVGLLLGYFIGILRYKLKVFESMDALVPGIIFWLSFYFLQGAIVTSNLPGLLASVYLLVLGILYFIFDKHYKSFSWYKSGRIGFSGLTVLGILFLSRAIVAATFPNVLSFVGTLDVILSAVIAFIAFLSVFNLARKNS